MKKSTLLLTAMPLFLAAAAMMVPGCMPKTDSTPDPVYGGDLREQQDRRIQTYIDTARELNDGEHSFLVCPALEAAEQNMARYRREPLEFGITRPGLDQIRRENHCP